MAIPAPDLIWWLGYLGIGAVVGTFAGLLGVGGGAIIIPLLALAFQAQGVDHEQVLHLAIGTAMATIVFTSLSSMRAHAVREAVRWRIAFRITPGIMLGSLIGAYLAKFVPTRALAIYFAVFVTLMALNMALGLRVKPGRRPLETSGLLSVGVLIGGLSSLIAMGGAVLTVPLMLYMQLPMIEAIGTAAAIGFPIATGGTIGYVATGWHSPSMPPWCIGYVNLPAFAGITIASVLTAPLGARAAHRLSPRVLRLIFATLLCALALRMLISLW
jgi:uncharacterized membrane protein YfcA